MSNIENQNTSNPQTKNEPDEQIINISNQQNTNNSEPIQVVISNEQKQSAPQQKPHITKIPREYKPLGMWEYFLYSILFNLPIIGFICLIIHSFDSNINLRNYAKSFFCVYILALIVFLVVCFFGGFTIASIFALFK